MLESHLARAAAAALLVLSAPGCDLAPEEPAVPPMIGKLPPELCAQAKESLDGAGKTGGFEHDGRGGATISEDAWIVMGAQGQGDLTQTLAVDAACKAGTVPREQQVFVRSEEGRILSSRIVEIAPATNMFFEN
jgi:hypothetical protein